MRRPKYGAGLTGQDLSQDAEVDVPAGCRAPAIGTLEVVVREGEQRLIALGLELDDHPGVGVLLLVPVKDHAVGRIELYDVDRITGLTAELRILRRNLTGAGSEGPVIENKSYTLAALDDVVPTGQPLATLLGAALRSNARRRPAAQG